MHISAHKASTITDAGHIEFQFSDQLRATFEPDSGEMWLRWNPKPRPCFNPQLLAACNDYSQFLEGTRGIIEHDGQTYTVGSSILNSDVRGVFNLGGDLELFTALIDERNRPGLMEYGSACAELVYRNYICYGASLSDRRTVESQRSQNTLGRRKQYLEHFDDR